MRKMFEFNINTKGCEKIIDSDLKITYYTLEGDAETIPYSGNAFSTEKIFDDTDIDESTFITKKTEDDVLCFYVSTQVADIKVGPLRSRMGSRLFPAHPNEDDIRLLKDFVAKIEEIFYNIKKERTCVKSETFYCGK